MTARRPLGAGPEASAIRAAQADLHTSLPGVRLTDIEEMRARGVLGKRAVVPPGLRRTLGAGGGPGEGASG